MVLDRYFDRSQPVFAHRMVHLDLKGVPPTPQRLLELLDIFKALRFDMVLVEWEDSFPWTVDERFRSACHYTPDEVKRFCEKADALGLQLVPLVQCLGHMQTPLNLPDYEKYREVPEYSAAIRPLAPGARKLIEAMMDDVLALMSPQPAYFHLGGDEARHLGYLPESKAFVEEHGLDGYYMHHVEPLLDKLNGQGIRPILWHDMMIHWSDDKLKKLSTKSDLMVWGYGEHPDETPHHYHTRYIQRFEQSGMTLWAAGAYKAGAAHPMADLPVWERRRQNTLDWIQMQERFTFVGFLASAWSRHNTNYPQKEPIDSALDTLVNVALILYNGGEPARRRETCLEVLSELGERQRYETCYAAMRALSDARAEAWDNIQTLLEQLTMSRHEPLRCGQNEAVCLEHVHQSLKKAHAAADQMRLAFTGLIDRHWVELYLAPRIESIEQQYELLDRKVEKAAPRCHALLKARPPRLFGD